MARLSRLSLPGFAHHVMQRGNNRQAIFATAADYQFMLDLINENARKFGIAIHAYVLMSNHFHLLVTPETAQGLPLMMQALGRRYVRQFNALQGRSGTLWEGRYRSALIQSERHLLNCMVYIDLNPVRAGLVAQPQDYPWSSFGRFAGLRVERLLSPHPIYWELGNTPFAREAAYSEMVHAGIDPTEQTVLTHSMLHGWALGDADFVADLQKRTTRRLSKAAAGRPLAAPKVI